jgi:hypothetical protein
MTDSVRPTIEDYVAAFCDAQITRKAVMDLSTLLAQVVAAQIQALLPKQRVQVGHKYFGGSSRRHHLDAFIANEHYGLQLGIDVKGLNSASSLGKNWNNRVGDLHELATNHHQNFPRAVMGGVLAIPYDGLTQNTLRNIERAMQHLGARRAVTNEYNRLESAALLVISKAERTIRPDIPAPDSAARFERFASTMAQLFQERWE